MSGKDAGNKIEGRSCSAISLRAGRGGRGGERSCGGEGADEGDRFVGAEPFVATGDQSRGPTGQTVSPPSIVKYGCSVGQGGRGSFER